ncbi:amino acid adenylation domain-containing protein [Pseudoalteromonas aurantia]|uniref:Carrier domain-containing protein n=1 Tax=Pseudoalteromonas aurantia 208 TaxID=1314867 RepID=A0ABR9EH88_9GAMM|nr:amino acid adenylation domain-containing protein [Pseudoalteromonas aurantia]MBE0370346.1 hypothetical protein [Pseudoalteromonas aurantia 208]
MLNQPVLPQSPNESDSLTPTLDQLVLDIMTQNPNALAIVSPQWQCNFAQLRHHVAQCLRMMDDHVACHSKPIGIYSKDQRVIIASMLACMIRRTPFVCLDSNFPALRVNYMVKHSRASYVLTDCTETTFKVPSLLMNLTEPDASTDSLSCLIGHNIAWGQHHSEYKHQSEASLMAYVVYTSGTTGQPKGIAISRASLAHKLAHAHRFYNLTQSDRSLCMVSCCTDTFIQQSAMTLLGGASLHFSARSLVDPEDFVQFCQLHHITFTDLAPSFCLSLLSDERATMWWQYLSLKTLVLGGEELNQSIVSKWHRLGLFSRCRLVNEYGPSETTITSVIHQVTAADRHTERVPIGRAVGDSQLLILDKHGNESTQGELYIGGTSVAIGYLHDAQKTAEKFVYLDVNGVSQRFYQTGDLVTRDEQGRLTFLGRFDNQVQIMGQRIELDGIEAVLEKYPQVTLSAVICVENTLIAYVTCMGQLDRTQLHAHINAQLPAYMQPNKVIVLNALPLTPIGKIDKKALHVKYQSALQQRTVEKAQTPSSVFSAIAEVLNISVCKLNVSRSFRDNGGDSLRALAVQARCKDCDLPVKVWQLLSDTPLEALKGEETSTHNHIFDQSLLNYTLPNKLSMIESPALAKWLVTFSLYCAAPFEVSKVSQVLTILLRKYPSLRLGFNTDPEPSQHLNAFTQVHYNQLDCESDDEFKRAVKDHFSARVEQMNISDNLLIVHVFDSAFGQYICFAMNHMLVDDISLSQLSSDTMLLLHTPAQFCRKTDLGLFQWQKQLHDIAIQGGFNDQAQYWLNALDHASIFFAQLNGRAAQNTRVSQYTARKTVFSAAQMTQIQSKLAAQGVNIIHGVYAALMEAFYWLTGESELLLSQDMHGRTALDNCVDVSQSVGWFANSVPILLTRHANSLLQLSQAKQDIAELPSGGHSFLQLLCFAQHAALAQKMKSARPYVHVVYENNALFDLNTLFECKTLGLSTHKLLDEHRLSPNEALYHLVQITISESETDGLHIAIAASKHILNEQIIERLLDNTIAALEVLV